MNHPNGAPNLRLCRAYRGWTIKVFNMALRPHMGWPSEWTLVSPSGTPHRCPTSFRSLRAALRDAKNSIDNILENEVLQPKLRRAVGFLNYQRILRSHRALEKATPKRRYL